MSDLSAFVFESQQVRCVSTAIEPEWITVDACAILEITNTSDTLASFDEYKRGIANIYTPDDDNLKRQ